MSVENDLFFVILGIENDLIFVILGIENDLIFVILSVENDLIFCHPEHSEGSFIRNLRYEKKIGWKYIDRPHVPSGRDLHSAADRYMQAADHG